MKPVNCLLGLGPYRIGYREGRDNFLAVDEKNRRSTLSRCSIHKLLKPAIRLQFQRREHVRSTSRQSPTLHSRVNTAPLEILEVPRGWDFDAALFRALHDRPRDRVLRIHLDRRAKT